MNSKKRKTIIIVIACLAVLVAAGIVIPKVGLYLIYDYPRITHHDIKKINLDDVNEIKITHNGETTVLESDSEKYTKVVSTFDNKKVKIEDDTPYLTENGRYEITITTGENEYDFKGAPYYTTDSDGNKKLETPVTFVLYDYTAEGTDYLYQTVTVSESEFNSLFNE